MSEGGDVSGEAGEGAEVHGEAAEDGVVSQSRIVYPMTSAVAEDNSLGELVAAS